MWGKSGSAAVPAAPMKPDCAAQPRPSAVQLTLPGKAEAVTLALREIMASDLLLGLSANLQSSAEIVLAEVLNNIVEHAYASHVGDIRVHLSPCDTGLCCAVTDSGGAMPGLCLPKGDIQPLGCPPDLPEGGFGWFLIRSLVTELHYQRLADQNQLTFLLCDAQS